MSKIIDFKRNGTVVRFYLGADDCKNYHGDDWDNRPYEHNAGTVYNEFVSGYIEIAFPMSCNVLDAESDYRYCGNSPFCKEDFKKRTAPCIVVLPPEFIKNDYLHYTSYSENLGNLNALRFYFEDAVETILNCPHGKVIAYVPDVQALNNGKEDQV